MKTNLTFISILFAVFVAMAGFFAVTVSAEACDTCIYDSFYDSSDYYYPSYDFGYGGGGYYPSYDPYYYFDFYYYEPPVYQQPPIYTPPALPTCTLSASQTNVTAGTPVSISWTASNATNGSISTIGSITPSFGSRTVSPQVTTTYVGMFSGQGGTTSCQTTVVVQPQTPPTCSLVASPNSINSGNSASLSWTSANATSMTITNVGSVATVGARTVNPGSTTTYIGTAVGQGGSATCQATVQVNQQPPIVHTPPSCTLSITNTNNSNGSAILSWSTNNANTVNITNVGTVNTGSGSRTVFPGNGSTTYVATVTGQGGVATCQTTTRITQQSAPWCTITASSNSVGSGNSTVLQWNTSNNAASFFINDIGTVNTGSGSRTVFPNTTRTYTGTVRNSNGQTANCQTTVGVFAASNVSLFQQPGDQPLAAVSLSQVPYTGFEASALVTFIFWFAVALWSMAITYIVVGKQGLQFIANKFFAFDTGVDNYQSHTNPEPLGTREDEYVNGFDHAQPAVQSTMTVDVPDEPVTNNTTEATLRENIESRAHASGVLMSPEAVQAAEELSDDEAEALQKFTDILNEAVQTLPREDGWILLSSDRFDEFADQSTPNNTAPEIFQDDLNV